MQGTRAVLNDRGKKKTSTFHKICTYEHSSPRFQSETLHGYEFSHIKKSPEQLVFHKQEVRPTPISLPTPPASPEFYSTSLQKWYQKKPLFTLTAKGQVKRLEKYLEIQKTLEICKREYEFQVHTEKMKEAYTDFEFRERQPFLYADEDIHCACDSSKDCDVDFLPLVDRTSSPTRFCCSHDYMDEDPEGEYTPTCRNSYFLDLPVDVRSVKTSYFTQLPNSPVCSSRDCSDNEQQIIPSKVIKEGTCNLDDHGMFKIVVRNKETIKSPASKNVFKLFNNKNFSVDDMEVGKKRSINLNEFRLQRLGDDTVENFSMPKITLSSLPFDNSRGKCSDGYLKKKAESGNVKYLRSSASARYTLSSCKKFTTHKQRYDMNQNEMYFM
ncbi:hypothetical protein WA026_008075 [Henosepilachna vigintioctopunctata]|uniref:Uncharacterized protein n=1 Tax=Henosepilachna vigintioctopunctata TaxID=420089 RepID=A0AAW1TQ89_9CUCU